jgi:hypothetical protein
VGLTHSGRFDRNERLFGSEGQRRLAETAVALVGLGGLGSHVAQQLAYLGVREFALIDPDVVTESSLNRLIGAWPADAVAGVAKVEVAARMIVAIQPDASVVRHQAALGGRESIAAIGRADLVMAGLDDDLARLRLTAMTSDMRRPMFDLASGVADDRQEFGGRVLFAQPGIRCAWCLDELDPIELGLGGLSPEQREARDEIYGIRRAGSGAADPAVVSLNGVIASLAVTEFMALVTGLRKPAILLRYRGTSATVHRRTDEPVVPCPYCGRD